MEKLPFPDYDEKVTFLQPHQCQWPINLEYLMHVSHAGLGKLNAVVIGHPASIA